jgi:hypothetical protein
VFQIVVRVVRLDTPIEVRWGGPTQLIIAAPDYRDNFLLSSDLRAFDAPLREGVPLNLQTPLGVVTGDVSDHTARVTLTLSADAQREPIHFFYYSDGRIQTLAPAR